MNEMNEVILCDYCGIAIKNSDVVKVGFSIGDNICEDCYQIFVKENDVLTKTYDLDME